VLSIMIASISIAIQLATRHPKLGFLAAQEQDFSRTNVLIERLVRK
jgi:hypothetical protein